METQRAAALFHFLPRGEDTGCGQGFAGSRQLTANDFQTLPRVGAAGRGEGVVCHHARGQELNPPVAGTIRKSGQLLLLFGGSRTITPVSPVPSEFVPQSQECCCGIFGRP